MRFSVSSVPPNIILSHLEVIFPITERAARQAQNALEELPASYQLLVGKAWRINWHGNTSLFSS